MDLPGYGYAGGDARDFERIVEAAIDAPAPRGARRSRQTIGVLLLVDARHPGLENDRAAWAWLLRMFARGRQGRCAIVATKIDKLSRAERLRATKTLETVFEHPVTAVSADTGEGLDELWKVIERLANSSNP